MARQLVLLETHTPDWRLDERTKAIGRKGIADARRALAEARRRSEAESLTRDHGTDHDRPTAA